MGQSNRLIIISVISLYIIVIDDYYIDKRCGLTPQVTILGTFILNIFCEPQKPSGIIKLIFSIQ